MTTIKFERRPGFNCIITSDDPDALKVIEAASTIQEYGRVFNVRSRKYVKGMVEIKYTKVTRGSIVCKLGMGRAILSLIQIGTIKFGESFGDINLEYDPVHFETEADLFPIMDKWLDIYRTNPKPDRRKIQEDTAVKMSQSKFGIATLFTGVGKTELLLGLLESFLTHRESGNAVILTFSSRVKEEIVLRAQKYGISLSMDFDPEKRVNIIMPTGLGRTIDFKSGKYDDWFSNVEYLQADEAHHFTASTWKKVCDKSDPEIIHCFTATSDSENGESLLPEKFTFERSGSAVQLVEYAGFSLVEKDLPVPVEVYRVATRISDDPKECLKWVTENPNNIASAVYNDIDKPNCANIIAKIYRDLFKSSGICFVSITSVQNGINLCRNLNELGVTSVFLSAEHVEIPGGTADGLGLDDLKELARDNAFEVLITTSIGVEGIDIPNLDSCIPLYGVSYKNIIQTLGRAARSKRCKIAFLFDDYNSVLRAQMSKKYQFVKTRTKVESNMYVDFRKI